LEKFQSSLSTFTVTINYANGNSNNIDIGSAPNDKSFANIYDEILQIVKDNASSNKVLIGDAFKCPTPLKDKKTDEIITHSLQSELSKEIGNGNIPYLQAEEFRAIQERAADIRKEQIRVELKMEAVQNWREANFLEQEVIWNPFTSEEELQEEKVKFEADKEALNIHITEWVNNELSLAELNAFAETISFPKTHFQAYLTNKIDNEAREIIYSGRSISENLREKAREMGLNSHVSKYKQHYNDIKGKLKGNTDLKEIEEFAKSVSFPIEKLPFLITQLRGEIPDSRTDEPNVVEKPEIKEEGNNSFIKLFKNHKLKWLGFLLATMISIFWVIHNDSIPTKTYIPPTKTDIPPTKTDIPPTKTDIPPTKTDIPPTKTDIPPTKTDVPPTKTDVPPTKTDVNKVLSKTETAKVEADIPRMRENIKKCGVGYLNIFEIQVRYFEKYKTEKMRQELLDVYNKYKNCH
jgi:hypothetical protein